MKIRSKAQTPGEQNLTPFDKRFPMISIYVGRCVALALCHGDGIPPRSLHPSTMRIMKCMVWFEKYRAFLNSSLIIPFISNNFVVIAT